ncbi:hypothetical protein [Aureimonas glaciei]|uniref:Uncharacterized protein n=1 Tax=Aureimonas glaciei TaxID=1776957 RepID=A0A916XZM7_9HYPH|nr:hypothetical protein [Aureimonas glaciei]GGD24491.1 hypothetical protein GCM10011335_29230 [Aureimonas glaciei]
MNAEQEWTDMLFPPLIFRDIDGKLHTFLAPCSQTRINGGRREYRVREETVGEFFDRAW